LGRIPLRSIFLKGVFNTLDIVIKSCDATCNVLPLTSLTYGGHHTTMTEIAAFKRLGPRVAAMAMDIIIGGNARKRSVNLIITSSNGPRKYPATMPKTNPINDDAITSVPSGQPLQSGRRARGCVVRPRDRCALADTQPHSFEEGLLSADA